MSPPSSRSGFFGSAAAFIVFIAAVVAVVQFFKQPIVRSSADGPITVAYEPQQKRLQLAFYLTLDNIGYGSEVISSANATLTNGALRKGEDYIPFANDRISFRDIDSESVSSAPVTINKESTKKLRCVIRHSVGPMSGQVLKTSGKLELTVNLVGKKRFLNILGDENVYQHRFCFDMKGLPLEELAKEPHKFHSVSCP